MSCECGFQIIDEIGSGGVLCNGTATVSQSPNRYSETGSGGATAGGSATVLTSTPFDGYAGVFHLQEDGDGTFGEFADSTGHNDGTGGTDPYTPTRTASTLWNYSQALDGNDYIRVAVDDHPTDYTVSLWFKITGRFLQRIFFARGRTDTVNGDGVSIALGHYSQVDGFDTDTETNRVFARVKVEGETNWTTHTVRGTTSVPNDCWHHLALVFDSGSSITLYLDGELEKTKAITETALVPTDNEIYFGRCDGAEFTDGELQEIRFIPRALSAAWIETEFLNLCSGDLIDEGVEQSPIYG